MYYALQVIGDIIAGLAVIGIVAILALGKRIIALPKEMLIVKAALFRLLRSNKLQGVALEKIAICQKKGCANGETEDAVKAVVKDQGKIESFLMSAALNKISDFKEED
jgi:hypothetical protein